MKKKLSLFSITMISIIAVDSIRTLPVSAELGFHLIFFYVAGGLLFLLPTAFIAAELASTWPETGGLYIWITKALGPKTGFIAAWFLWLYNLIWFPTILMFMALTLGYCVGFSFSDHPKIILLGVVALFWLLTFINCFGVKTSSFISNIGAVIGTLLPIAIIILVGWLWVDKGLPVQIHPHIKDILPTMNNHNLGLLTGVIFGLVGMEVSATFAGDVKSPRKHFPIALFVAAGIILLTLIGGSYVVAMVIPNQQLNLATGVIATFSTMFTKLHLQALTPFLGALILIGSLGGMSTWMAGPSRSLMAAAQKGYGLAILGHTNRFDAPAKTLIIQAIVVTILCSVFLLFPNFNSAYWLLTDATSQLSIVIYLLLFISAIVLKVKYPNKPRAFAIPGGLWSMVIIAGLALITCFIIFILGFIPPQSLHIAKITRYETLLVLSLVVALFSGLWVYQRS